MENYFRCCNLDLLLNLMAAALTVAISAIAAAIWGLFLCCMVVLLILAVAYLILQRKKGPLEEEAGALYRSFAPVRMGLLALLVLAFICIWRVSEYSHAGEVESAGIFWGLWGGLIGGNLVGGLLVPWLEKALYKLQFPRR